MQSIFNTISHFHPLLVHLPIGILLLAFLLEIFSRYKKDDSYKPAISFSLLIAAIAAILSLITGWLIPKAGNYDPQLVDLHFWFALALTISLSVLSLLSYVSSASRLSPASPTPLVRLYLPLFFLNIALLIATGHFGGSLTHGSNYLFEQQAEEIIIADKIEDIQLFEQVIQPIFTQKCTSCHNPEKLKGELLLTTIEGMQKGGKTGALFVANDPDHSLIVERIELPNTEKKHMPPKGKAQLTNDEIKLLKWWIAEGGKVDQTVAEMAPTDAIKQILGGYISKEATGPTANLESVDEDKLQKIRAYGILLNPQDEQNILFEASLAHDTAITSGKLKALRQIRKHIIKLNLSFSNLDDDLVKEIRSFTNLQKLDLQRTSITSDAIADLTELAYLQSLNLYGTQLDDRVLPFLSKMKALKRVYLWQSQTTSEAVEAFALAHPQLQIHHQVDMNLFGEAQLKPPTFLGEAALFKDSLEVELKMNFKGVDVFYTLDGGTPDTTSQRYTAPFHIYQTREIKVIAHKAGWITSEVAGQVYIRTKYEIADIALSSKPNEKYAANGPKSLTDFVKGPDRFSEGGWLGYEGEHVTAILDLGAVKLVSSVTVGALEDVGSYIFYPKGIEISISQDGVSYQKIAQKDIPTASEPHPSVTGNFLVSFEEIEARYVKVFVKSNLKNPAWHPAPGAKCWVFLDEVVVN